MAVDLQRGQQDVHEPHADQQGEGQPAVERWPAELGLAHEREVSSCH